MSVSHERKSISFWIMWLDDIDFNFHLITNRVDQTVVGKFFSTSTRNFKCEYYESSITLCNPPANVHREVWSCMKSNPVYVSTPFENKLYNRSFKSLLFSRSSGVRFDRLPIEQYTCLITIWTFTFKMLNILLLLDIWVFVEWLHLLCIIFFGYPPFFTIFPYQP